MVRSRLITFTLLSIGMGCGLVSGLDTLHVGDLDAALDAGADVGLPSCDGGCGLALPTGFAVVTYATGATVTCPSGTTPQDVVADPAVSPAACSCKCTMTTRATCSAESVSLLAGDAGLACPNVFTTLSGTPGCHMTLFSIAANTRVDESATNVVVLDAGVCGTSEVTDASTLATTPAHVCVPTSCAATDTLCTPQPGQRLCVAANGDVACPSPFTEKHLIGLSASVSCSSCAAACTINPQNCSFSSQLKLFTDTACSAGSQSVLSCVSIGGAMTVKSYEYTLTASGGCTTLSTSTASTSLTNEETVCCQP
jgi:hypothetical protein